MRKVYLDRDEEVIKSREAAELRRIRIAHDATLAGWRTMMDMQAEHQALRQYGSAQTDTDRAYHLGWLDCFAAANRAIVRAADAPLQAAPDAVIDDLPF